MIFWQYPSSLHPLSTVKASSLVCKLVKELVPDFSCLLHIHQFHKLAASHAANQNLGLILTNMGLSSSKVLFKHYIFPVHLPQFPVVLNARPYWPQPE